MFRLGLVLNLIGWKIGESLLDRTQSEVKQNHSHNNPEILSTLNSSVKASMFEALVTWGFFAF